MFKEISYESEHPCGFNEMDETQTAFTLSEEFLNEVSIKGLKMLMNLVEKNSQSGINIRNQMSKEIILKTLNERIDKH